MYYHYLFLKTWPLERLTQMLISTLHLYLLILSFHLSSVYFPRPLEYRVTDSIPKVCIELIQTLPFYSSIKLHYSPRKKEKIQGQIHILQKVSTLIYLCIPN